MKYFIGVGDGHEGYGGNWGEFHKCVERPEDSSPQLVEVNKGQFIEYVLNNKDLLDINEWSNQKAVDEIESDEELYFHSNGENDFTLASRLNVLAKEHNIKQPGYDEEEEDDDCDDGCRCDSCLGDE